MFDVAYELKSATGAAVGGIAFGALAVLMEATLLPIFQSLPIVGAFVTSNVWRAVMVGNGAALGNAFMMNRRVSSLQQVWAILKDAMVMMLVTELIFLGLSTSDTGDRLLYVIPLFVGEMTRVLTHAAVSSTIGRMVDSAMF